MSRPAELVDELFGPGQSEDIETLRQRQENAEAMVYTVRKMMVDALHSPDAEIRRKLDAAINSLDAWGW